MSENIKLIVTDVDGTLVPNGEGEPDGETKEAVRAILDKGISFAIASGRVYSGVMDLFGDMRDRLGYVTGNGAMVTLKGERIKVTPMADDTLMHDFIGFARRCGYDWIMQGTTYAYEEESCSRQFKEQLEHAGIQVKFVKDIFEVDDYLTTFSLYAGEQSRYFLEHDAELNSYRDRLNISHGGPGYIDVFNKTVTKGYGVKILMDKLGVTPDETAVFGDAMNDITMFEVTPNSFAVEDGDPRVKELANYRISSPKDRGLLQYLKKLL